MSLQVAAKAGTTAWMGCQRGRTGNHGRETAKSSLMLSRLISRRGVSILGLAIGSALAAVPSPVHAVTDMEAAVGISYGHLDFSGADGTFRTHDGVRFEPRFSLSLIDDLPQLRLGVGVGISGYSETTDDDLTFTDDNGNTFEIDGDSVESLTFVIPELQVSWRQPVGDTDGGSFFVEPGGSIGLLIANYNVSEHHRYFDSDEKIDETDTTFAIRPFVRAGYAWSHFATGIEVSYLFGGNIDLFGEVDGHPRELLVGGFFAYRF